VEIKSHVGVVIKQSRQARQYKRVFTEILLRSLTMIYG
jgi:hypothetical protein